jgi:predicted subunit of tRNA(5-methylaminomethyl-2-thiouridylate) methyltransferase
MFDAFPFDEWGEDIAEFWTFGGEGSTGTWIMTALGFSVMLIAFIGFVILENRKLARQAAILKASGALERPAVVVTTVITSD